MFYGAIRSCLNIKRRKPYVTVLTFLIELDLILAYWDYGTCGPVGNDANWDWCERTQGSCKDTISTSKCSSGTAKLQKLQKDFELDGCKYHYRADYACTGT